MDECAVSVQLRGGLGNRMFQAAAAAALADAVGGTAWVWTPSGVVEPNPHVKDAGAAAALDAWLCNGAGVYMHPTPSPPTAWFTEGGTLPNMALGALSALARRPCSQAKRVWRHLHVQGWLQSPFYAGSRPAVEARLMAAWRPTAAEAAALTAQFPELPMAAFVHVRGGDYTASPLHTVHLGAYYAEALASFPPTTPLIVLTDDVAAVARVHAITAWRGPCRVVGPADLASPRQVLHVMTLAAAGGVAANSSLSWWGVWLSTAHAHACLCLPARWYANDSTMSSGEMHAHAAVAGAHLRAATQMRNDARVRALPAGEVHCVLRPPVALQDATAVQGSRGASGAALPPAYVISMPWATQRLADCLRAWDGTLELRVVHGIRSRATVNGCSATHVSIALQALQVDAPRAPFVCVVEDDALPTAAALHWLPRVLAWARTHLGDWDVINLGPSSVRSLHEPGAVACLTKLGAAAYAASCMSATHAVVYNRAFLPTLRAWGMSTAGRMHGKEPKAAIDYFLGTAPHVRVVVPPRVLAVQAPAASDMAGGLLLDYSDMFAITDADCAVLQRAPAGTSLVLPSLAVKLVHGVAWLVIATHATAGEGAAALLSVPEREDGDAAAAVAAASGGSSEDSRRGDASVAGLLLAKPAEGAVPPLHELARGGLPPRGRDFVAGACCGADGGLLVAEATVAAVTVVAHATRAFTYGRCLGMRCMLAVALAASGGGRAGKYDNSDALDLVAQASDEADRGAPVSRHGGSQPIQIMFRGWVARSAVVEGGACISRGAVVGEGAYIGVGAVVCAGAQVGAGARVGAGALVPPLMYVGSRDVVPPLTLWDSYEPHPQGVKPLDAARNALHGALRLAFVRDAVGLRAQAWKACARVKLDEAGSLTLSLARDAHVVRTCADAQAAVAARCHVVRIVLSHDDGGTATDGVPPTAIVEDVAPLTESTWRQAAAIMRDCYIMFDLRAIVTGPPHLELLGDVAAYMAAASLRAPPTMSMCALVTAAWLPPLAAAAAGMTAQTQLWVDV